MDKLQFDNREIPLLEPPLIDYNTPRRLLSVLFKRKLFIAVVFLVLSLPVLIMTLLKPTKYLGTVKVMIKPSRVYFNISPGAQDRQLRASPSPAMINTEIQIMTSREIRRKLIKEVPFTAGNKGNTLKNINGADGEDKESIAQTRKVIGSLNAKPMRNSNIIRLTAKGLNPEYVARVVNKAAELYMEHRLTIYKTKGVQEFYDEQENRLQTELIKAETALKEYQKKENIVDIGKEISSYLAAQAASERNLNTTESTIQETKERIRILTTQLKQQQETISSSKSLTVNPVYGQVRNKLTQLELERNSLLQRYTPGDRRVIDKESEITNLKDRLATLDQTSVGSESISLNSIRQKILGDLLSARVQLLALKEKRSSLRNQFAAYSSMAAEKKKKSFDYDPLQRNVDETKKALALYKGKSEEARISDALLDESKFGNVTIFQRAALPLKIDGFSPWIIVLAIILFSIAIAVGGAFAIEFFNTTLRNETDVEEQTGLPILATIQDYRS